MTNGGRNNGRTDWIAFALILSGLFIIFACSIGGSSTSQKIAPAVSVAAYSANDSDIEENVSMPEYDATYIESFWEYNASAEETPDDPVPANDTVVIDAGMLVSCSCRTCHSADDGKKKTFEDNTTDTTVYRQYSTTTTTTLSDTVTTTTLNGTTTTLDTTTTTDPASTTTTSVTTTSIPGGTTTTTQATTTSSSTTTFVTSTTTTSTSSTTTTIPQAGEFSSLLFPLAILLFAPGLMFLAAKR